MDYLYNFLCPENDDNDCYNDNNNPFSDLDNEKDEQSGVISFKSNGTLIKPNNMHMESNKEPIKNISVDNNNKYEQIWTKDDQDFYDHFIKKYKKIDF